MRDTELIKELSMRTGAAKENCEFLMDKFVEITTQALAEGEKVYVKNLMVLEPYELGARKARNPKTGEITTFPPSRTVKCRFSKKLKKIIKNNGEEESNEENSF